MELHVLCKARFMRGLLPKKTMLTMKLTIFLLLAATLQISAKTYSQKVTLTAKDISLEKVLRRMEQQTGYSLLCNQQVLSRTGHLDIRLKAASLAEALAACLQGGP